MTLNDRVAAVFASSFGIQAEAFSPDTVPEDVAQWDSLGHMRLVMGLEDAFDIHFEVDEITEMGSGRKILELLRAKGVND